MTIDVKWVFIYSIFIYFQLIRCIALADKNPLKDFTKYSTVKPRIYHGRSKTEISNTLEPGGKGGHAQDLFIFLQLDGFERILELTINRDLIGGSYFRKTQKNGSYHIQRPAIEELELCHYSGFIQNIPDSWAAISTCSGLRGMVFDGNSTYFIERGPESEISYVYNGKHLREKKNESCGVQKNEANIRFKRDADVIRGPYNANRQSRYVELLLVVDNKEFKELGNLKAVFQYCKDIANIINALFVPLNIFIALIGVVVWTDFDEISLTQDGDTTLTNFLHYRREVLVKQHPNDNAQLLTRIQFKGGVVGKALKGPICTFEYSGGVFMDHSNVVGLVATTVAHELGHNFGMEHDGPDCQCPDDRCIMAPSSSSMSPSHWSSCSLEFLAWAFEHGMDYCLRNKPEKLFDSPVCGNGFVEPGEQCDCGLPHRCDNPCCNATSCMLLSNASCATGECCDFQTCKPKNAGTLCRSAEHECDLPEYCTGESEYCPGDVFKIDGEPCSKGKAFCYQGMCRTHSDQCQLLWGPSGKNSEIQCYEMNTKGTKNGNCGYNRLNQTYIKCVNEDVYCGMVHCSHLNERLEFGLESASIQSQLFINKEGEIIPCRTAIVDLGLNEIDPGLAPNGAKCGEGKMCVNQKCMSVGDLRKMLPHSCHDNCSGNGVCNSKGHCHCAKGFAPPFCDYPGTGGSVDSGPASDPNSGREFTIALYVIFLCIIPVFGLAFMFMYYTKQNAKIWWKKSPTRLNVPWDYKRQSPSRGTAILLPESTAVVDTGMIRTDRESDPIPSLPNDISSSQPKTLIQLQSDLIGEGRGFAIKPLKKSKDSVRAPVKKEDSRVATAVSYNLPESGRYENVTEVDLKDTLTVGKKLPHKQNSWRNEDTRLRIITPPTLPDDSNYKNSSLSFLKKSKPETPERKKSENVDIVAIDVPVRPQISDPVLEGTTAKDLIAEGTALVPTRKAPEIPRVEAINPPESVPVVGNYNAESNSVPVTAIQSNIEKQRLLSIPSESFEEKQVLKELKEGKEYHTLTKLANLIKNSSSNVNRSASVNEKDKSKSKIETKKIKFDREKLKNIQISNPIPQVGNNGDEKEAVVLRAQSMRESKKDKPNSSAFGSLRLGGGKRPTSIHVPNRPTSPPPRPPPPKPSSQEYAYDDCLNLTIERVAPLAHLEEECSPSPNNIYAVIEESPKLETERKGHCSNKTVDLPQDNKCSTSLNNINGSSGSTESVGLLSEIVSEIQARNLDSIYSSGTLQRKKKKLEELGKSDKNSKINSNTNSNIYISSISNARNDVSSSSSSSGYLNPKNLNSPVDLSTNVGEFNMVRPKPVTDKPIDEISRGVNAGVKTMPNIESETNWKASLKIVPNEKTSMPKVAGTRNWKGSRLLPRETNLSDKENKVVNPLAKACNIIEATETKTIADNLFVSRPLPSIPKNDRDDATKERRSAIGKELENVSSGAYRKNFNVTQLKSQFEEGSVNSVEMGRKSPLSSATVKSSINFGSKH